MIGPEGSYSAPNRVHVRNVIKRPTSEEETSRSKSAKSHQRTRDLLSVLHINFIVTVHQQNEDSIANSSSFFEMTHKLFKLLTNVRASQCEDKRDESIGFD